jgi:hypothetical protein
VVMVVERARRCSRSADRWSEDAHSLPPFTAARATTALSPLLLLELHRSPRRMTDEVAHHHHHPPRIRAAALLQEELLLSCGQ